MRLSGLQKEVLALYRHCLRESRKKPHATRTHFENFARQQSVYHIESLRFRPVYSNEGKPPSLSHDSTAAGPFASQKVNRQTVKKKVQAPKFVSIGNVHCRQRRISRSKRGIRVSKLLPTSSAKSFRKEDTQVSLAELPEHLGQKYGQRSAATKAWLRAAHVDVGKEANFMESTRFVSVDGPPRVSMKLSPIPNDKTQDVWQPSDRLRQPQKRSSKVQEAKRYRLSDPAAWNAIHRTLCQQDRFSSVLLSGKILSQSSPPSVHSRTSSRRRALNRFSRQLERYAAAANVAGKLPVMTPTDSDEKVSLQTIKPLLPYVKEFEAAGLAVTSEQQRPRPNPDDTYLDGQFDKNSDSSSTSSGSLVQFTPPDGILRTYPEQSSPVKKNNRGEGKTRLPWLRKRDSLDKNEPTVQSTDFCNSFPLNRSDPVEDNPKPLINASSVLCAPLRISLLTRHRERCLDPKGKLARALPPKPQCRPYTRVMTKRPCQNPDRKVNQHDVFSSQRFQGSREITRPQLPRPTKVIDKRYPMPSTRRTRISGDQRRRQFSSRASSKNSIAAGLTHQKTDVAPELPFTWKHAVSNASSLERALNIAAKRVDELEAELLRPKIMADATNLPREQRVERKSPNHPHHPLLTKQSCPRYKEHRAPTIAARSLLVDQSPYPPPKYPAPKPPRGSVSHHTGMRPDSMLQTGTKQPVSELETVLSDLDCFFSSDDEVINDRDVLQGLQVAVRAAADDLYDALVQKRTGLRIRRFLANLKFIDIFDGELAPNVSVQAPPTQQSHNQVLPEKKEHSPGKH
ncbi:hypothetical protein BX600DRAFT_493990 [Xylariales sp. PMI_506]|nr:hypothetical protein BX600DRAFT_493990 [Xylariales sp. PMI_506]